MMAIENFFSSQVTLKKLVVRRPSLVNWVHLYPNVLWWLPLSLTSIEHLPACEKRPITVSVSNELNKFVSGNCSTNWKHLTWQFQPSVVLVVPARTSSPASGPTASPRSRTIGVPSHRSKLYPWPIIYLLSYTPLGHSSELRPSPDIQQSINSGKITAVSFHRRLWLYCVLIWYWAVSQRGEACFVEKGWNSSRCFHKMRRSGAPPRDRPWALHFLGTLNLLWLWERTFRMADLECEQELDAIQRRLLELSELFPLTFWKNLDRLNVQEQRTPRWSFLINANGIQVVLTVLITLITSTKVQHLLGE